MKNAKSAGTVAGRVLKVLFSTEEFRNGFNGAFPKYNVRIVMYKVLGAFTVLYGLMLLYLFHKQLGDLPVEAHWFWAATLFVYFLLTETFRWSALKSSTHWGEFFAWFVILLFSWMLAYNIFQHIYWGRPYMKFPDGAFRSALEALMLWAFSFVSSALHSRTNNGSSMKKNIIEPAAES